MTALLTLAILFMLEPERTPDLEAAKAISADADNVYEEKSVAPREGEKSMRIVSETSDFDRGEGVALFEGKVLVTYGNDCTLSADQLYVFTLAGTNRLDRIVAIGNVAITNETRVGSCAMAQFKRDSTEIDMYGDSVGRRASLVGGSDGGAVEGSRIRFWLDSEQVEVENSAISAGGVKGKVVL